MDGCNAYPMLQRSLVAIFPSLKSGYCEDQAKDRWTNCKLKHVLWRSATQREEIDQDFLTTYEFPLNSPYANNCSTFAPRVLPNRCQDNISKWKTGDEIHVEQLDLKVKKMSTMYFVYNVPYMISSNRLGSGIIVSIRFEMTKGQLHL